MCATQINNYSPPIFKKHKAMKISSSLPSLYSFYPNTLLRITENKYSFVRQTARTSRARLSLVSPNRYHRFSCPRSPFSPLFYRRFAHRRLYTPTQRRSRNKSRTLGKVAAHGISQKLTSPLFRAINLCAPSVGERSFLRSPAI